MERNWLIRTKSRRLLGPVSKQKIVELLKKGSLGEEDELCPGNGWWFWVREKDLLDKYVYGDETQGFNPISEGAPSSGTATIEVNPLELQSEEAELPTGDDLEYPEPKDQEEGVKLPSAEDLEYPVLAQEEEEPQAEEEIPQAEEEIPQAEAEEQIHPPSPSPGRWVRIALLLLLACALGVIAHYKFVLKRSPSWEGLLDLISPPAAASAKKKLHLTSHP